MFDPAFFVTGHGRSGTKWLAQVLNEDPGIDVRHEPVKTDAKVYTGLCCQAVTDYLESRKAQMTPKAEGQKWGEVNSYLRYWVQQLCKVFPGVPVVGLVRDGRYVVRSLLKRGVFKDPQKRLPFVPPSAEPFVKACCYWANTYKILLVSGVSIYKLEQLNDDYEYFSKLCLEIGALVSEGAWRRYAGKRIHVGVKDTGAPRWTEEQRLMFKQLAGNTQRAFGYEVEDG